MLFDDPRVVPVIDWLRARRSGDFLAQSQAAAAAKEAAADADDFRPLRVLRLRVAFTEAGFPTTAAEREGVPIAR